MPKRRRYSPEEIERGLTTLILAGSSPKAEEITEIPEATLRTWKLEYVDKYDRLCKDLEPRVVEKIASEAENIVIQLADVQRGYVQRMHETMHELKPGEIPGAMRNAATAAALNIDKLSSPLRERPSHVQQTQDLDGMVKAMGRLMGFDATSTAEDITNEPERLPLATASDASNARETAA